ncbi:hypothetical protein IW256_002213 [Actinomadura viridis]|uniref:Transposase n=1 Tax=Actinomadura viridis TaxID=58110 RepID=A0A931GI96_9ACTN|nr:hypothetical protein [Actinomadura viridis]
MAAATGMSQSAVSRIWRAFGLKPHTVQTWKLSSDPQFVGKVRDVVGLYLNPPENALVLAVDEKSQMQAIGRTAPDPADHAHHPGPDDPRLRPARHHQSLRRLGPLLRVGDRPALPAPPPSRVPAVPQAHRCRRAQEPGPSPGAGKPRHPQDEQVKKCLIRHPRFHLHFTPTNSSWLNLVKRWFAELTNRKLRRSAHRSVIALERDVRGWVNEWNKDPKPFVWIKTADEILETLAAYCQRINDSQH